MAHYKPTAPAGAMLDPERTGHAAGAVFAADGGITYGAL